MASDSNAEQVRAQTLTSQPRVAAVRHAREDVGGCEPMVAQLVRLVADAANVPVVVASLLTADRQVLVAGFGMSGPSSFGTEVPFARSLCDEVVAGGLPLIIGDVACDRRFVGSRAGGQAVGAYAGFPVRGDAGQVIGVLDMADYGPRHWSTRELASADNAAQLFAGLLASANASNARGRGEAERRQALTSAVLDSLDTGVAACDARGDLVLFNRAMRGILSGAESDDSRAGQWAAGVRVSHPDGRAVRAEDMPLARALAGDTVRARELVIVDDDGRQCSYMANAEPINDQAGGRLGAVTALHEVTDERRTQRFRRCEIAVAQAAIRATSIGEVGQATLVALAETLGWPYAELWLHDPTSDTMRPAGQWQRPGFDPARPVPDHLGTGVGLPGLVWSRHEPIWVDDVHAGGIMSADADSRSPLTAAVVVPLRIGTDVYGALNLFTTAAERPSPALNAMLAGVASRLSEYVQQSLAKDLARHLTEAEDSYMHLLSHEMRTPLTSIASYTELLTDLDGLLPADAREMLQAITRNSDSLRRIVDRLLELAALDSDHTDLPVDHLDLAILVGDALAAASDAARDRSVRLVTDLPVTLLIDGDTARLRRVVDELVSNAITYSHPGAAITVTLVRSPDERAVLTVTDTGIGIPTDELTNVLERFHRSSRVRELGIPGTGLGLAFSRIVLQRHHGALALHPNSPGGVTATVTLPLSRASR
jgi:signal transduction histidine kinase/PAS domain-containing protein